MADDVDGVDELYDLEPGAFVAARDQLAKRLREQGDRAGATAVRKLRRPTVTAWALNQVVRRHRAEVEELLELGRAAAAAQEQALSGGSADLRGALQARNDALHRVAGLAERLLDARGSTGDRAVLLDALSAAAGDEEVGAELLAARLDRPPEARSGLEALGSLDVALAASLAATGEATAPDATADERAADERAADERAAAERAADERAAAAARRAAAEERVAAALDGVRDAEAALERAREAHRRLEAELEELAQAHEDAVASLRDAEEELRRLG